MGCTFSISESNIYTYIYQYINLYIYLSCVQSLLTLGMSHQQPRKKQGQLMGSLWWLWWPGKGIPPLLVARSAPIDKLALQLSV